MHAHIERLFQHIAWADRQVLDRLRASPDVGGCEDALHLYAHVLAAERVWLLRLRGEDSGVQPIWPDLDLAAMEELVAANAADYAGLMEEYGDREMEREIEYRNSTGKAFRTLASDILLHVALHGSYHRGQVARELRRAGIEPVNTDYIIFIRAREPS